MIVQTICDLTLLPDFGSVNTATLTLNHSPPNKEVNFQTEGMIAFQTVTVFGRLSPDAPWVSVAVATTNSIFAVPICTSFYCNLTDTGGVGSTISIKVAN